jgi:hypothetical protein
MPFPIRPYHQHEDNNQFPFIGSLLPAVERPKRELMSFEEATNSIMHGRDRDDCGSAQDRREEAVSWPGMQTSQSVTTSAGAIRHYFELLVGLSAASPTLRGLLILKC